jgi:outer membrane lipoprotein SlyB
MGVSQITVAAASCSWIDPNTGLPEVDVNRVTSDTVTRAFLTGNSGYRFCNFMEVSVFADFGQGRVVSKEFTVASGMYRGPSFAHLPSHAFPAQQDIFDEADALRFTQLVGARTVSPEVVGAGGGVVGGAIAGGVIGSFVPVVGTAVGAVVGGIVGGVGGEIIGHRVIGFPPIWAKIQIRIYRDGRTEAQLLQHSLFPSLTFYSQSASGFTRLDHPSGQRYYDATKSVQLPDWEARGWGRLQPGSVPGPTAGNPWGVEHGVTGGADVVPTPVR